MGEKLPKTNGVFDIVIQYIAVKTTAIMEKQEFLIPIDEPKREFKQHLELPYNKRILFSAPFGTGKTYFLNKFFEDVEKDSKEETKYKVIHLFPVNYSVSSNEDVFELIKFDILFQLLEREDLDLDKLDFTPFFTSQFFLLNNAEKFGEWVLKCFGKTGKSLVGYAKAIEKLINEYKRFEEKMQANADADNALSFLLNIKGTKGTAYEEDAITKLIQSFLQQLCGEKRESVLVIDDLDRIDPEHIFRLLNVFAAHFDIGEENTNKFGFTKVILVCDITNVRNIFHAKYGAETDFTGYIDKFYSADVFSFKNEKEIIDSIAEVLGATSLKKSVLSKNSLGHFEEDFLEILQFVLQDLYLSQALNIRSLKKLFHSFDIDEFKLNFAFIGRANYNNKDFFIVILFQILCKVYGNIDSVERALEKASKFNEKRGNDKFTFFGQSKKIRLICMHIFPLLVFDIGEKSEGGGYKDEFSYFNPELGLTFHLHFVDRRFREGLYLNIIGISFFDSLSKVSKKIDIGSINYIKLLLQALRKAPITWSFY